MLRLIHLGFMHVLYIGPDTELSSTLWSCRGVCTAFRAMAGPRRMHLTIELSLSLSLVVLLQPVRCKAVVCRTSKPA